MSAMHRHENPGPKTHPLTRNTVITEALGALYCQYNNVCGLIHASICLPHACTQILALQIMLTSLYHCIKPLAEWSRTGGRNGTVDQVRKTFPTAAVHCRVCGRDGLPRQS